MSRPAPRSRPRTVLRNAVVLSALALAAYATISQPASAFVPVAGAVAPPVAGPVTDDLARVRAATARYQDVANAIADGYVSAKECVAHPGEGGMGVHFVHPARMGLRMVDGRVDGTDVELDPTKPELLVYAPQPDGSLRLGAVEYYVARAAWGDGPPPAIFGVPFDPMADDPSTADVDEGHGFTPHYDQHVWLWKDNPNGTFAQWNPTVSCPAEAHGAEHRKH